MQSFLSWARCVSPTRKPNISPLMFGTYRCPDHEPANFGLKEQAARTYVGLMVQPFERSTFGARSPAPAPLACDSDRDDRSVP
jgi:hypothetical protein